MRNQCFFSRGSVLVWMLFLSLTIPAFSLVSAQLPVIPGVAWQPLRAQVRRLIEATDYLGVPFSTTEKNAIESAMKAKDPEYGSSQIQAILDQHCLYLVNINPEMRVKVAQGPADPYLMQHGWTQFLVKVNS